MVAGGRGILAFCLFATVFLPSGAIAAPARTPSISQSSFADPVSLADTFSRSVANGLGISEINGYEWSPVASPVSPTLVDGTQARWNLNYPVSDYEDNSWHLDLQAPQLPFEALVKLSVNQSFQAIDIGDRLDGYFYLSGSPSGTGVGSNGATAAVEFYQSTPDTGVLTFYPTDDRQVNGTYQFGSADPGFWQGGQFWIRLRIDSLGVFVRSWPDTSQEPTTWTASYSGDASRALTQPFRYFGITLLNTGVDDPQTNVAVDSVTLTGVSPVQPSANLPVMFIHGPNGDARQPGFGAIRGPLGQMTNLVDFRQYQDQAYRDANTQVCAAGDAPAAAQPNGGMPADVGSISSTICDSQGDFGLNAVKLDTEIQRLYRSSGNRPVVIVANSGGAPLVRGMFAYSAELGDNVGSTMVDSVTWLEGAQAGSLEARRAVDGQQPGRLFANWILGYNFSRPAVGDVAASSAWYQWANPPANHLPSHPYFNVYGDMQLVQESCVLVWCNQNLLTTIGDGVMQPGLDDPHAVPASGGARFLPGAAGSQQWQWQLSREFVFTPIPGDPGAGVAGDLAAVLADPIFHPNFGSHMSEINTLDCQTHASVSVDIALLHVIEGRVLGSPYNCVP